MKLPKIVRLVLIAVVLSTPAQGQSVDERIAQAVELEDWKKASRLLLGKGDTLIQQRDLGGALEAYLEGRRLAERGEQTRLQIQNLRGIANSYLFMGRLADALETLNDAQTRLDDQDDPTLGHEIEATLAIYYSQLQDYEKAREHFRRAGPATHPGSELNYGIALERSGHIEEAKRRLESALEGFKQIQQPQFAARGEASALLRLGDVELGFNRPDEAEELYAQAEERAEAAGPAGTRIIADVLIRRCELARSRGDEEEAEASYELLLERADEFGSLERLHAYLRLSQFSLTLGPELAREHHTRMVGLLSEVNHPELRARASNRIGTYYFVVGEWATAREWFRTSMEAWDAIQPDRKASTTINLGIVQIQLGDYASACRHLTEGLELATRLDDRMNRAWALLNIGVLQIRSGLFEASRRSLLECIVLFSSPTAQHARHDARVAGIKARINLGECLHLGGNPESARQTLEDTLREVQHPGDRYLKARCLARLAEVESSQEKHRAAQLLATEAISLFEDFAAVEEILEILDEMALAARAAGDIEGYRGFLERAMDLLRRPSLRSFGVRERALRRSYFATWSGIAQDLVDLEVQDNIGDADATKRAWEDGFRRASEWKAQVLLETLVTRSLDQEIEATELPHRELAGLTGELLATRSQWRASDKTATAEGLETRAEELASQTASAAIRWDRKQAEYEDSVRPKTASLQSLRRVLPPGTAVVEYVENEVGDKLLAYVVSATHFERVSLGPRQHVLTLAERFVRITAGRERLSSYWKLGPELYERLIGPLRESTLGADQLVIIPSAGLSAVPFAALPSGTKNTGAPTSFYEVRFLVEDLDVSYAASTGVLIELGLSPTNTKRRNKALILGDPYYSTPSSGQLAVAQATREGLSQPPLSAPCPCGSHGETTPTQMQPLALARRESIDVARTLLNAQQGLEMSQRDAIRRQLNDASIEKLDVVLTDLFDLCLGDAAKRGRLAGDLRQFSLIHIAAHGMAEDGHTGLFLSPDLEDSGFVSLSDLIQLQLDARVVVLSACSTAAGQILAGEGVQSVAWALQTAGARGVVASLWLLEEPSALIMIGDFYRSVAMGNVHPARALGKAQRLALELGRPERGGHRGKDDAATREERAHPYYWAPLVYTGAH